MSARSWCFTINNWTDEDLKLVRDWNKTYMVVGQEVGESGTPHLQGYITFERTYTLSALKKLHEKAHWEKALTKDAANYCMKDGKYEIQDNRKQGKRSDLESVTSMIKERKPLKEIAMEHPIEYIKYNRGIEKLAQLTTDTERTEKPTVTWIWGETGTGKTRYVYERHKDIWACGRDLKWWDGYNGQEVVLLDDFRGDMCKFRELLRILDRYPYRVEFKGGSRNLNSPYIYITCPYPPDEVYNTREDIGQLLRRIDSVLNLKNPEP